MLGGTGFWYECSHPYITPPPPLHRLIWEVRKKSRNLFLRKISGRPFGVGLWMGSDGGGDFSQPGVGWWGRWVGVGGLRPTPEHLTETGQSRETIAVINARLLIARPQRLMTAPFLLIRLPYRLQTGSRPSPD